ncbi:MAG: S8 family serine peptidase [Phycisphaeraceae bacterium]|nr:S8 family serine peptidase [Phycisphaeraceae bacterium]
MRTTMMSQLAAGLSVPASVLSVLILACGAAASTGSSDVRAAAGPTKNAKAVALAPERIVLWAGAGSEAFLIDTPDAPTSPAARDNADMATAADPAPAPTPGYTITNTVLIKAANLGAAQPVLDAAKATAAPMASLSGWHIATAPSVRSAAALAAALRAGGAVEEAYVDIARPMPLRTPNDPSLSLQWHLQSLAPGTIDVNVVPAWNAGFTGTGITVAVVEDGYSTTHPDILSNYDAASSMAGSGLTGHGTSVAGLVAATGNNGLFGAGVAYGAKVSKLYRGSTSVDHVTAFGFRNDVNFIKTNSWGPFDNGLITYLTAAERDALAQAVATGRGGKGTVFCWAAGNGGVFDRLDYDPFASSRYVIAVGAVDNTGVRAYYNETGASMFIVAPSNADGIHPSIYTTTGTDTFGNGFGGTSATSPQVAGVIALMLQARPALTWRDVKHILVRTARWTDASSPGWRLNGAGRRISYDYGFGAVDAAAAVSLAQAWPLVQPEQSFATPLLNVATPIPNASTPGVTRTTLVGSFLNVETAELVLNVSHTAVGDLRVTLTSPSGTVSEFATPHPDPTDNYTGFVFTTARCWDERSNGVWTVSISDEQGPADSGTFNSWQLKIYGTTACPADWDGNGTIEPADIAAYVQQWVADVSGTTTRTNFDADPQITPADLAGFIQAWVAALNSGGC